MIGKKYGYEGDTYYEYVDISYSEVYNLFYDFIDAIHSVNLIRGTLNVK